MPREVYIFTYLQKVIERHSNCCLQHECLFKSVHGLAELLLQTAKGVEGNGLLGSLVITLPTTNASAEPEITTLQFPGKMSQQIQK